MSEANTPDNPPLLEEGDLTPAEKKVLKAFREGWEAGERQVIVHPGVIGISSAEELAKMLKLDATLRASFLRSLFLGSYDRFDTRAVTISCARIEGELDLDYCESRFPLRFFWCIFSEGISLQAATIPELVLMKCVIGQAGQHFEINAPYVRVTTGVVLADQFKSFGEVNLNGADIGGQLVCAGGHFETGLKAQKSKVGESVFLDEDFKSNGKVDLNGANIRGKLICSGGHFEKGLIAQNLKAGETVFLGKGFRSNGDVDLFGADIGGQLDCVGGHFEKDLKAQDLKTGAAVLMHGGFKSNGEVELNGANIGGQLDCADCHFEKGLKAQNLKTGADVLLREGFKSNGEVDLTGATIVGELSCAGCHFEKGLTAQRMKTSGAVLLIEGFNSNGNVDLLCADIGRQFSCAGGYFKKGLIAQNLNTGESVLLMEGFKSDGKVNLNGANISGQLTCNGGHFEKGLIAQNLKTGADVFLSDGFQSNGKVSLSGSDIRGQLNCIGGHFKKGLQARRLKAGSDVILSKGFESNGEVNLNNADISGTIYCAETNFQNGLGADGLRYQWIELGGDWEKGLAWLQQIQGDGLQPYEQLMTVYRRMGKPGWAREIGFVLEKKRHRQSKGLWRAWYSVLKWTIGYGYKPFRSLGWAAGLVAAGFLLFSSGHNGIVSRFAPQHWKAPAFLDNTFLGNEWIPSEVEALESASWTQNRKPPPDYQPFNPMVYSLEAAFPVLPLGQLDKWRPSSLILSGVRWIWTFTGSTLLAILALFGVGALGPNRKNEDDSG